MSRVFPKPSREYLSSFAYHSTRIERIPVPYQAIANTLSGSKPHPYLQGQFSAINFVLEAAPNPDLIPASSRDARQSLDQLKFLRLIHINLFSVVAEQRDVIQDMSLPEPKDLGQWRQGPLVAAGKEYPNPVLVPHLLHDWWTDLIGFHSLFRAKIETPGSIEEPDIQQLSQKAHEAHLKLYNIKPFDYGSNQVSRLLENLLRLNWGLPWRIFDSSDDAKIAYANETKQFFSP